MLQIRLVGELAKSNRKLEVRVPSLLLFHVCARGLRLFGIEPQDVVGVALEAIQQAANTGSIGDGKIFMLELNAAVRIRTGETGAVAL